MTRIKQARTPVLVVTLIAGLIGYIIGCSHDKFIFDIGTGSAERISAFQIPYNYLDKVFISHLHTDHFGDAELQVVIDAWPSLSQEHRSRQVL